MRPVLTVLAVFIITLFPLTPNLFHSQAGLRMLYIAPFPPASKPSDNPSFSSLRSKESSHLLFSAEANAETMAESSWRKGGILPAAELLLALAVTGAVLLFMLKWLVGRRTRELADSNKGLWRIREELEERIRELTAKVVSCNETLEKEIAGRREVEEQIRRSHQTFSKLVERAPLGIYVVDSRLRIVQMNSVSQAGAFRNVKPALGRDLFEALRVLWPEPVAAEVTSCFRHTMETGDSYYSPRFINPRHDLGTVESYEWELHRISLPDGQYGVVCYYFDSTQLRQAEQAQRESRERLQQALMVSRSYTFDWDPETDLVLRSESCSSILGLEGDEVLHDTGQRYFQRILSDDRERFVGIIGKLSPANSAYTTEYRILRRDGSIVVLEEVAQGIFDENGRLRRLVGVATDITERHKAEEALRKANEGLEETVAERTAQLRDAYEKLRAETEDRLALEAGLRQAQKMEAIGTLAGGIAHDFNNILAAIIGNTELALDDTWDEEVRYNLEGIMAASKRGSELVSQILAFSRKSEGAREPFDVINLVAETFRLLRSAISKHIEMTLDVAPTEAVVDADPSEIQQVVMNLANNAAHAMREEGGLLAISLENTAILEDSQLPDSEMAPGEYVLLTVRDTGIGMNAEVKQRIFEPFFTTKGVGEGTGMGLSVVYGIVKKLKGGISVETAQGKGSTFRVFLPRVSEVKADRAVGEGAKITGGHEKILFIDDEEAVTRINSTILGRLGYDVTSATDPNKALEVFEEDPARFDLVITDQAMPGLTGMKLAEKMLKLRGNLPIILCTGYSDVASPEKAKAEGIAGFIRKPYEKENLAKTVRQTLDDAHGRARR